jgi:hypothetical protein
VPTKLRLKPSVSLLPTRAGVLARSDLGTFQIAGADAGGFVSRAAPLLDGSYDREAIAAALAEYSPASVFALLAELLARGLVEEVPDRRPPVSRRGRDELFRKLSIDPAVAAQRLTQAHVIVLGGGTRREVIAAELVASGVGAVSALDSLAAEDAACSLLIALITDPARIEQVSRLAHAAGTFSLWACLAGTKAEIGPLVFPGQTACRVCASVGALNPPLSARPADQSPATPAMEALLGHLVATEAIGMIAGVSPSSLGGRVWIHDLVSLESARHTLVRIPWCAVCGQV